MIVGARVSTGSQSLVAQDAALHAAGCSRMFQVVPAMRRLTAHTPMTDLRCAREA
jgi:hypothetical protein